MTLLERAHRFVDWAAAEMKWLLIFVAFGGTLASTVLGIIAGSTWPDKDSFDWWSPAHHTLWLLVAVVLSLAAGLVASALIDISRRGQDRGRIRAKVIAQEGLREAVLPSLRSVGRLATVPSTQRAEQFTKMVSQVLMARSTLFAGKAGVRMVVYECEGSRRGNRSLTPFDHDGRSANIPTPFESKQIGRGSKVFEWLDSKNPTARFVANSEDEPDKDWAGTGNGYRTYISVPIRIRDEVFGMLTVDAPNPGDLDETDISMIEVLAQILAIAFVIRPR
ncbi:MAG: GAF domain-containing protein [Actinobacteria bacterium]|nr:GAF domain-containing protein [Actinomycetota bacterium]